MPETAFERVVKEATGGCGCACHAGLGCATACEHCAPQPAEEPPTEEELEDWAYSLDRLLLDGKFPSGHLDFIRRLIAEVRCLRGIAQAAEGKHADLVARIAELEKALVDAPCTCRQPRWGRPKCLRCAAVGSRHA